MFERVTFKTLPDGSYRRLYPFHVCLQGVSNAILCRDDEDLDAFVKYILLCAWRMNVLVVAYIVMSNHLHVVILAPDQFTANSYANELKRINSMYFTYKYGRSKTLKNIDSSAPYLDTIGYLRNSIAYTFKNALDTGCKVDQYPWSSYKAMFQTEPAKDLWSVSRLSTRDVERIFHTNMDISRIGWKIDNNGRVDPASACVVSYAEEAFNNDLSYFWKVLGMVNVSEMDAKLIDMPRQRINDQDFFKMLSDTSERWFNKSVDELSQDKKIRLVSYVYHSVKTSPSQIARGLGLDIALVERLLKKRNSK